MKIKSKVSKDDVWTIIPADKPVLFWDTCALLDCLRIVMRYDKSYFDNYNYVLSLIVEGEIVSIISEMVLSELDYHWDSVIEEADKHQIGICEFVKKMIYIFTNDRNEAENKYSTLRSIDAIEKSKNILEQILEHSYVVENHQQFQDFAHFRVVKKFAPAHVKQEYKDCYIWGCTNFCAQLRSNKDIKVMYISSNTEDYMEKDSKKDLDKNIQNDCVKNKISFAKNIGELRRILNETIKA